MSDAESTSATARAGAGEAPARPRGRPRSDVAHRAILLAAVELLPEFGFGLPIEAVASRAGVGKTTIYRRWANSRELIADAISLLRPPPGSLPDTGSLIGDLNALSEAQRARLGGTGIPRIVPRLLADAASSDELHELIIERAVEPIRGVVRDILVRAVARGELRDDVDVELLVDVFHALPVYKILLSGGSLDGVIPVPQVYTPILLEGLAPRRPWRGQTHHPG
ncbi:MAG TPA: TetR/AcrR family transcriptional regulator [Thermoleophilaceae bacterium]|nr:TetR/AcrR family transcriptional regulator [Thermoleophilaceae bacterium]